MGWRQTLSAWKQRAATAAINKKQNVPDPIGSLKLSIPWLTDRELGALLDALEAEKANRQAQMFGFWDTEAEVWIDYNSVKGY